MVFSPLHCMVWKTVVGSEDLLAIYMIDEFRGTAVDSKMHTPRLPGTGADKSNATDVMEGIQHVSSVAFGNTDTAVFDGEDDDANDNDTSSCYSKKSPAVPSVDVKALARRKASDPFTGYNVVDIHDDPLGPKRSSSFFNPLTFKMYTPAMDVDALCTELLDVADDILANAHQVTGRSRSFDDGYDETEEKARRLLAAKKGSAGAGRYGELDMAAQSSVQPSSPLTRDANSTAGSMNRSVALSSSTKDDLSLSSQLQPSFFGGPLAPVSAPASGPGAASRSEASVDGGSRQTKNMQEVSHPDIQGSRHLHREPSVRFAPQVTFQPEVQSAANAPVVANDLSAVLQDPTASAKKKRLSLLLRGLRNGDFNAEFIQSVQQLRNPEDAIAVITSYYEQGKHTDHKQSVELRRIMALGATGGRHQSIRMPNGVLSRPSSADGNTRASIRSSAVAVEEPKERPATPPNGEHDRREILRKVLNQRRDSEIRRINGHTNINDASRRRSLSRLNSLTGQSGGLGGRRKSSFMSVTAVTTTLGELSVRWKKLRKNAPSSSVSSESEAKSEVTRSEGAPDVGMLFFRHSQNRVMTMNDVVHSSIRFMGTLSYVYFFPPTSGASPSSPPPSLALTPPQPDMSLSDMSTSISNPGMSAGSALTLEQAIDLCNSIISKDPILQELIIPMGQRKILSREDESSRHDVAQRQLFPIVHHRLRTLLVDNNGSDFGSGIAGVAFFSSMSRYGVAAETFEVAGRRVYVSRWRPLTSQLVMQSEISRGVLRVHVEGGNNDNNNKPSDGSSTLVTPSGIGRGTRSPTQHSLQSRKSPARSNDNTAGESGGDGADTPQARTYRGGAGKNSPRTPHLASWDGHAILSGSGAHEGREISTVSSISSADIKGLDGHKKRLAMHRKSLLQFPTAKPPVYLTEEEKRLEEKKEKSVAHGTAGSVSCKTHNGFSSSHGEEYWVSLFYEGTETFPPAGLDVAQGVREGHVPRLFESLTPRPPSRIQLEKCCYTPRSDWLQTGGEFTLRSLGTATTATSPSGEMIHRTAPLPLRLMSRERCRTVNAPFYGTISDRAEALFPALVPKSPANNLKHSLPATPSPLRTGYLSRVSPGARNDGMQLSLPTIQQHAVMMDGGKADRPLVSSRRLVAVHDKHKKTTDSQAQPLPPPPPAEA